MRHLLGNSQGRDKSQRSLLLARRKNRASTANGVGPDADGASRHQRPSRGDECRSCQERIDAGGRSARVDLPIADVEKDAAMKPLFHRRADCRLCHSSAVEVVSSARANSGSDA